VTTVVVSFLASSSSSNVLGISWLMDEAIIIMSRLPEPVIFTQVPVSNIIVPSITWIWVVEFSNIVQLISRESPVSLRLISLRL